MITSATIPEKVRLRREALERRAAVSANGAAVQVRDYGLALLRGTDFHGRPEGGDPRKPQGTTDGLTDPVPRGDDVLSGIVSGYLPIRDELTPLALLSALSADGHPLALPVIDTKWAPLIFRAWKPGDRLVAAEFGLKEPAPEAAALLPDILLIPLAAFDAEGYRIGYGGGYYDRTLELYRRTRAITAIGIAYECQEVPVFTHEPHDQRLDYLITPAGVRTFGP